MLKKPKVVIVVDGMSHYREAFFTMLQVNLLKAGVQLELIYGIGTKRHNIAGIIHWAHERKLQMIGPFLWLPVLRDTRSADLVILPQVLKHLHIYPILLRRAMGKQRVALWGHGKVFSALPESKIVSFVKRLVSRHCDWWFAYTARSARVVRDEIGFPPNRITVVNNAVDTKALTSARERLTDAEIDAFRIQLGIATTNVGIFVGGMYHSHHHTKRLPFLIQACIEIHKQRPDFEMIFIGGGPEQGVVEEAAIQHPWMHYYGIKKGPEAVPYWALAKVCLNPGLVGLGILDCLALGVPMVTSEIPYHSPEIEYLSPGVNGIMVNDENDPRIFAQAAISLLDDNATRLRLAEAGKKDVNNLTNEAMVANFVTGILSALVP